MVRDSWVQDSVRARGVLFGVLIDEPLRSAGDPQRAGDLDQPAGDAASGSELSAGLFFTLPSEHRVFVISLGRRLSSAQGRPS